MGALFYKGRFRNRTRIEHASFGNLLKWMLTRRPAPWPDDADADPGPPPPQRVEGAALRVTFINHATSLIQTEGLNVLTDPIWSERCSPVSFAGPKRHRPPGVPFEDLPPIDLVLLSHNHYDHLDVPTLERLARTHAPAAVTGLGNGHLLARAGFEQIHELDWWESVALPARPDVRVTATPAQHFSGRSLFDRDRTLWCGLALTAPSGTTFFAGDSAYADHFAEVRERIEAPRLALLPIGAYEPQWFMRRVHMNPADAVRAHLDLQAGTSLGVHFGTFRLTDEGIHDPPQALARAVADAGLAPAAFRAPENGTVLDVPARSEGRRAAAE